MRSYRRQPGPRREDPSSIEHVLPARSATRTLAGTLAGTSAGALAGTLAGTSAGTLAGTLAGTSAGALAGTLAGTSAGTSAGALAGTLAGTPAGTSAGTIAGTLAETSQGDSADSAGAGSYRDPGRLSRLSRGRIRGLSRLSRGPKAPEPKTTINHQKRCFTMCFLHKPTPDRHQTLPRHANDLPRHCQDMPRHDGHDPSPNHVWACLGNVLANRSHVLAMSGVCLVSVCAKTERKA